MALSRAIFADKPVLTWKPGAVCSPSEEPVAVHMSCTPHGYHTPGLAAGVRRVTYTPGLAAGVRLKFHNALLGDRLLRRLDHLLRGDGVVERAERLLAHAEAVDQEVPHFVGDRTLIRRVSLRVD